MNKQKGNILIIILSLIIIIALITIGTVMFLSQSKSTVVEEDDQSPINGTQDFAPVLISEAPTPSIDNVSSSSGLSVASKPIVSKNNPSVSNDFYNCDFSGLFGKEGGNFVCQNGGGIKIELNSSKFPDFKSNLKISVPSSKKIYETLSSEVPYIGAIEISMTEPDQPLPTNISKEDMKFIITMPLKSKLTAGTKLEVFLKGEIHGEWIKQDDEKTGSEIYAIVNQDGLTASFKPETAAVGLFVARIPDKYSIPTINYDEIVN